MPDMPLTRETLVELRRLQKQEAGRFFVADAAIVTSKPDDAVEYRKFRRRLSEWAAAHEAFRTVMMTNADALLDAAERGLDVGDGR